MAFCDQRFAKAKTAFLLGFASVINSAQAAVFKRVDPLLRLS
jgi:hypothetical protein